MKAFPFYLDGVAKDWLYLQSTLLNTWGDMEMRFLEKFFPASRTTSIKKEICGIRQHNVILMEKRMIDAISGGVLMDKTLIGSATSRVVNKVVTGDNQRLENKITNLTSLIRH
ncbi:hypothetical protein CR513_22858, partial [Mucuna pruriens]